MILIIYIHFFSYGSLILRWNPLKRGYLNMKQILHPREYTLLSSWTNCFLALLGRNGLFYPVFIVSVHNEEIFVQYGPCEDTLQKLSLFIHLSLMNCPPDSYKIDSFVIKLFCGFLYFTDFESECIISSCYCYVICLTVLWPRR